MPPERLVFTFEYEGIPGHILQQTITFAEHDGKTTVSSTALFDSVEERAGMLASGMESGATSPGIASPSSWSACGSAHTDPMAS